jgi:hypothetical protein
MSIYRASLRVGRSLQIPSQKLHLQSTPSNEERLERIKKLGQTLHEFAQTDNLGTARQTYGHLVKELSREGSGPHEAVRAFNRDRVRDLFAAIGRSGRPTQLMFANIILADLPKVFGLEPNTNFHTVLVRGLLERGDITTAGRWLLTMRDRPGHLIPTHFQWHLILERHAASGDVVKIFKCLAQMPRSGIQPNFDSFDILWSLLESKSAPFHFFESAVNAIHKTDLPYSHRISKRLRSYFVEAGRTNEGIKLLGLYRARYEKNPSSSLHDHDTQSPMIVALADRARTEGVKPAVKRFVALSQHEGISSSAAMAALLDRSTSISALRTVEEKLRHTAEPKHWTILINNAIKLGELFPALSIYAEAQKSGIEPDALMVQPIISALCQTAFKQPEEEEIDLALEIYGQLYRSRLSSETESGEKCTTTHVIIFNALLRALSSAPNVKKYHPIAVSLVNDMRSIGIDIDQPMMTASLASIFMRHSSSYRDAFQAYHDLCRSGAAALDEKGHVFILNVFCKLTYGSRASIPPLALYFKIVKDMRNAGHGKSGQVYAILWRRFIYLATTNQGDDFKGSLISAIRRSHDALTLDASFTPTVVLWSQLMDTYQRAGAFREAYKIWDMLYRTRTFTDASIAIILDACGYAGAEAIANEIWSLLQKDNIVLTGRIWLTWLECLCRLKKLDDAVSTVCSDLHKFTGQINSADVVRILFTFAKASGKLIDVKTRLQCDLPDVWRSLPQEVHDI